jgi:hypothetical protein
MPEWNVTGRSQEIYDGLGKSRAILHEMLNSIGRSARGRKDLKDLLGLDPGKRFEVHSLRPARRVSPDGESLTDLVIEITQARPGYFDEDIQKKVDAQGSRGIPDSWLDSSAEEPQAQSPKWAKGSRHTPARLYLSRRVHTGRSPELVSSALFRLQERGQRQPPGAAARIRVGQNGERRQRAARHLF